MAKAFSPKNYFKKIYSAPLLTEYYKRHDIDAFFEITEQTARKNFIAIVTDFYATIPPAKKIDIEKELAFIQSISTKYAVPLFIALLKKNNLPFEETEIECNSDFDKVLYYYMYHKEIFDEVVFYHDFYSTRGYMLYEAKDVDLVAADMAMTTLSKDFTRIVNKEDGAIECDFTSKELDGLIYVAMSYEGGSILEAKKDASTGEVDRLRTVKKLEVLKIVYLPKDKEVLISYTGSKYEKLLFLDSFLRTVCNSGFEDKVESFDLSVFTNETFDFSKTNKGVPLLTWKVKSVTLSFGGNEKAKKKMKLLIPSSTQEYGMTPLLTTLGEIGILTKFKEYRIENIALSFSFTNAHKADKSISVACSISNNKSSLCPLFPYDRLARTLLKQAQIELGFIEQAKKEKEDLAKKWEI